jgi:hypothetical protein
LNPYLEAKNSKNDFSEDTAPSGAGDANYSELFLSQILVHFSKLMEVFQAQKEEN